MGERYTILGWAWGVFTTPEGRQQPYANLFVSSPLVPNPASGYNCVGSKAEKLRCVNPAVWEQAQLVVGEDAFLIFDRNGRVSFAQKVD